MTTRRSFRWGLALATFCILLAAAAPAPAWGADHVTDLPPPAAVEGPAAVADVQALIDAGRFEEAIVALRPLLAQPPVDANVLFLYGVASLEAAQMPRPRR